MARSYDWRRGEGDTDIAAPLAIGDPGATWARPTGGKGYPYPRFFAKSALRFAVEMRA
jgi:hypothetical protein